MPDEFKRILFLCTGNYYRSRFAEVVFNHLARERGISWVADSCGLRVQAPGVVNHGPLSPFAEAGLEMRAIPLEAPYRFPRQVTGEDLAAADLIVAVKEVEHRPLMATQFPDHLERVMFWEIHDLDAAPPMEALAELERHVLELVESLAGDANHERTE